MPTTITISEHDWWPYGGRETHKAVASALAQHEDGGRFSGGNCLIKTRDGQIHEAFFGDEYDLKIQVRGESEPHPRAQDVTGVRWDFTEGSELESEVAAALPLVVEIPRKPDKIKDFTDPTITKDGKEYFLLAHHPFQGGHWYEVLLSDLSVDAVYAGNGDGELRIPGKGDDRYPAPHSILAWRDLGPFSCDVAENIYQSRRSSGKEPGYPGPSSETLWHDGIAYRVQHPLPLDDMAGGWFAVVLDDLSLDGIFVLSGSCVSQVGRNAPHPRADRILGYRSVTPAEATKLFNAAEARFQEKPAKEPTQKPDLKWSSDTEDLQHAKYYLVLLRDGSVSGGYRIHNILSEGPYWNTAGGGASPHHPRENDIVAWHRAAPDEATHAEATGNLPEEFGGRLPVGLDAVPNTQSPPRWQRPSKSIPNGLHRVLLDDLTVDTAYWYDPIKGDDFWAEPGEGDKPYKDASRIIAIFGSRGTDVAPEFQNPPGLTWVSGEVTPKTLSNYVLLLEDGSVTGAWRWDPYSEHRESRWVAPHIGSDGAAICRDDQVVAYAEADHFQAATAYDEHRLVGNSGEESSKTAPKSEDTSPAADNFIEFLRKNLSGDVDLIPLATDKCETVSDVLDWATELVRRKVGKLPDSIVKEGNEVSVSVRVQIH